MPEGKAIIGKPVITCDTIEEIGRVKQVIVHRTKKCVVGFLLRRAGWFQHARMVPFTEVTSFDKSAVMIPSASSECDLEQVPGAARLLERTPLSGSQLISTEGHAIGRIGDFYFDEETGEIDGFQIFTELAANADAEPRFLPVDDEIFIGKDDVVISEDAANRFMNATTESTSDTAELMQETTEFAVFDLEPVKPRMIPREMSPPQVVPNVNGSPLESNSHLVDFGLRTAKPVNVMPLKIAREGSSMIVAFDKIDIPDDVTLARYREQIFQMLAENENCTKLTFDVTNIKMIPSLMLGLLASLRKKVGNVEILNPSPDVRDALKFMGFDKFMTITEHKS